MDAILARSRELQTALTDFVLDAEGELAAALETFAAELSRAEGQRYDASYERNYMIDAFITEGKVQDKTPLEIFIASEPNLSASDRDLLQSWQQTFTGLFSLKQILPDGLQLMNWLTAKHYTVKPNDPQLMQEMSQFKLGEIILARISPITADDWTFSGPYLQLGNLGKPKLAVAIGNFKKKYKNHLYSDAPDLLAEAWDSVAKYHQEFIEFFGSDRITMSGYELNKKISEFQEKITQERMAAAGIDESKSLQEVAAEAGISEAELKAAAEESGADAAAVSQLLQSPEKVKMVMPKAELPPELKKAEQVTVFAHPRWGQMFLPTYTRFTSLLASGEWQTNEVTEKFVRKYLEDPEINTFVWQQLAAESPQELEKALQTILNRPNFNLQQDLESLLQEYYKPLEPELPEIASVPLHLHNLFQEALAEVQKSKSKSKAKKKTGKGFLN